MPGVEQSILTKLLDKYSQELLDTTVNLSMRWWVNGDTLPSTRWSWLRGAHIPGPPREHWPRTWISFTTRSAKWSGV